MCEDRETATRTRRKQQLEHLAGIEIGNVQRCRVDAGKSERNDRKCDLECAAKGWARRMEKQRKLSMLQALPPELECAIIDGFVHDEQVLKTCSLVCRRFCVWGQSRLFCDIVFGHDPHPLFASSQPALIAWSKRAEKLLDILESAPHLVSYIRRLDLEDCTTELLAVVASRSWSSLEILHLQSIPPAHEGCLQDIQRLVSTPSLQYLELWFQYGAWNTNYFIHILAHTSAALTELELSLCNVAHPSFVSPEPQYLRHRPQTPPKFRLRRLNLVYATAAFEALDDPYFASCLQSVSALEYNGSAKTFGPPLLNCIGRQIRWLKVESGDYKLENLDLRALPLLTHLHCDFTSNTSWNVLSRFPRKNRVTHLTLTTLHTVWQPISRDQREIGRFLERTVVKRFPRIDTISVEVTVSPRYVGAEEKVPRLDRRAVTQAIKLCLPRLSEADMVSITFLRFIRPPGSFERRSIVDD
ncbi:hypothetical protein HMN09_00872500 [Mycena chlorophos]|uniref:F-box domain-containing protein n=1 Tax=Mycena chlorophos TaxID=658473 RepID=A0A8H6W5E0_MYCCL|nr:hypothetical protein HMN09_00872500 [Mycena chlorophos]